MNTLLNAIDPSYEVSMLRATQLKNKAKKRLSVTEQSQFQTHLTELQTMVCVCARVCVDLVGAGLMDECEQTKQ